MTATYSNPEGLPANDAYHHVAVAAGTRQVHIAGQVAYDVAGAVVGPGDLTAQVAQAYRNVATALTSVGATFHDVVRLTVFVVGWTIDQWDAYAAGVASIADELGIATPPASLIGVAALFEPDLLVEIEAAAVLP